MQYSPFKEGKGTLAERAKKLGLNDAAQMILDGQNVGEYHLQRLVNPQMEGLLLFLMLLGFLL